ncbi:MAG: hypothetical protein FJ303_04325 [Planctomycetes bacterium]|nr:hypothetical protein [Planctomycetota bacterium]
MGFFTGRLTCMRFRVGGRAPRTFAQEHLDALAGHAIGKQRIAASDGSLVGWIAADHILDTSFELAKNIVNDSLHFAMRIDEVKMPADLLRAYYQVELQALAATNPSGHPSSRQKRQAREYAKDRLENEAKDGRYVRRKAIPILWDAPSNELLVGTTSVTSLDRLVTLFHQTFDRKFELLGAGRQAFNLAEVTNQTRHVDDATPTIFVPGGQLTEVAWMPDENKRDFLGNEFLLWLWHFLENEGDVLKLSDDSEATLMITKTLQLECPRGQTGRESISSEGPSKLPEAHRALQAGKLPRKMGLTVVRHESQYELTMQAESLAVGSARLPAPEADEDRARLEERVTQIRHLLETLDLIYAAFMQRRLGDAWTKEAARIKKWLHLERRPSS